jgi:hypothetical protein
MTTTTKAVYTATQRAVDAIVQMHDARQRKHNCPGYDCSICSLHADESRMAEIIDRETGAREMLETLEAISDAFYRESLVEHRGNVMPRVWAAVKKAKGGQ